MRRKAREKDIFKTPLGWAGVAVSERGIAIVVLPRKEKRAVEKELKNAECRAPNVDHPSPRPSPQRGEGCNEVIRSRDVKGGEKKLEKAVKLLRQYFSGKSAPFDLQLDLHYHTTFQKRVWRAATTIPYGETRSYGWVAKQIGQPKASRAVGRAMGANPIPIIIP